MQLNPLQWIWVSTSFFLLLSPSDIRELFLWPQLRANQGDAASAHSDGGHLHASTLGRVLHHLPVPGRLPRHQGPYGGSSPAAQRQLVILSRFLPNRVSCEDKGGMIKWSQGLVLVNIFARLLPSVRRKIYFLLSLFLKTLTSDFPPCLSAIQRLIYLEIVLLHSKTEFACQFLWCVMILIMRCRLSSSWKRFCNKVTSASVPSPTWSSRSRMLQR